MIEIIVFTLCLLFALKVLDLDKRIKELEAKHVPVVPPSFNDLGNVVLPTEKRVVYGLVGTEDGSVALSKIDEYVPEGKLAGTKPIKAKNAT